MLVDDDAVDAMTVKRAFEDLGLAHPLVHVTDGERALAYLRETSNPKPAFVLLDLNMPKMNGIEFLRVVKADQTWKGIRIIVLTTSGDRQDVGSSYAHGAAGYFIKPVGYAEFVETVRTIQRYWTLCRRPIT